MAVEAPERKTAGTSTFRLAVVGCGAIAEQFYLPALAQLKGAAITLVDSNPARANVLAKQLGEASIIDRYQDLLGNVDGAIVATPHSSHYSITSDFLSHGCHVLCEKPLTLYREQAESLVSIAKEHGVTLSVNNTRRLFPASSKMRELIQSGFIGRVERVKFHEGGPFAWPTASGFYFTAKDARGVLLDRGAHVLDLLCWWLGGTPVLRSVHTDSMGGPESVAFTRFTMGDCECSVKLSWLSKLANRVEVYGEKGTLIQSSFEPTRLTVNLKGEAPKTLSLGKTKGYSAYAHTLIENFRDVVRSGADPIVSGEAVVPSIGLLEECYAKAQPFNMPWDFEYL